MKVGERKDDICVVLIIVLNLLIFYPLLDNFFLLDDARWIKRGIEFKKNFSILFSPTEDGFLRPYLILIFWFVYPFFKLNAIYYYFLNICLHIINSILVYFLANALFERYFSSFRRVSFVSSLFFSSFYAHYQAVTWIAAIPHLVSTLGFLLSVISYIKYFRQEKIIFLFLSIFFATIAFFSRESTLVLPIILLLVSFSAIPNLSKHSVLKCLKFTLPYFFVALLHLLMYKYLIGFNFYQKEGMTFIQFLEITFSCLKELILTFAGIIKISGYEGYIFKLFSTVNLIIVFLLAIMSFPYGIFQNKNIFLKVVLPLFFWTVLAISPFVSPVISSYGMFHRHRYLYFPSVSFCLMASGIIFSLHYLREEKIRNVLVGLLISGIVFVNSFAIRKVENYYHEASLISYTIVEMAKKEGLSHKRNNLFLIDFPSTPWVVFIPYHIEDLTKLFFGDNLKVIRVTKKEIDILRKNNLLKKESVFLEYENNRIANKTKFYEEN